MARTREHPDRERRIIYEAVVDAYDEVERAMGWYYYLQRRLQVPFAAKCRMKRDISPLKVGDMVQVVSMARPSVRVACGAMRYACCSLQREVHRTMRTRG